MASADDTPSQQDAVAAKNSARPVDKPEPSTNDTARPPSAATSESPATSPHVLRAQLTSGIEDREPVDRIDGIFHTERKPLRRLYYFTELEGLSGRTVTHSWWHDGRLVAKVVFRIGSDSWRIYSSKKLIPGMTGPWRVVMTDSQGKTLSVARFVYEAP